MSKMTKNQKEELEVIIDSEGFEYTFAHYSAFSSIKDKEFHLLRNKYLKAREALIDYLGVACV